MRTHKLTSRRFAIPCAVLVAAVGAACVDVQESDATRRADSATAVTASHGADSLARLPDRAAAAATGLDTGADTAHSIVEPDAAPLAATPPSSAAADGDLAILRSELAVPVQGVPRSALRDTYEEMRGGTRKHEALDIGAARGTPVLAAAPGKVLKLFSSKAGGLMVYAADSTGRFILMYGHLDAYQPGLADGQSLMRGQPLGIVGTTGNAPPTVPHLHFAIARTSNPARWWTGVPVNPYPLLK